MADQDKGIDATKKRLAEEKQAREKKQADQRDAMANAKPTPTQEENDLAASGEHLTEHEPDGSPPDPHAPPPAEGGGAAPVTTRQSEAKPAQRGDYSTRSSTAAKHE
jgi:hypothetical protein